MAKTLKLSNKDAQLLQNWLNYLADELAENILRSEKEGSKTAEDQETISELQEVISLCDRVIKKLD